MNHRIYTCTERCMANVPWQTRATDHVQHTEHQDAWPTVEPTLTFGLTSEEEEKAAK